MDEITLTIVGIIVTAIVGIPAWFPYLKQKYYKLKNNDEPSSNKLNEFYLKFGQKIKEFRKKEDLSEEDFVNLIDDDIPKIFISKWEKGESFPSEYLPNLLDILGIVEPDFDSFALKYISESELSLLKINFNKKKSLQKSILSIRRSLLFGPETREEHLFIIAPYSSSKSQFRDSSSDNYVFIDNLGDRDSLLELAITLSRLFPYAPINFFHSKKFPDRLLENDMILVGGIGYPDSPNNHVALHLIKERGIPLKYEGNNLVFKEHKWSAKYENNKLIYDVGLFASLKNPWNEKKRIISIQGIHTGGVLGGVRAFFSLNTPAIKNWKLARQLLGSKDYCAIFEVRLFDNRPVTPTLKARDFFEL